MIVTIDMLHQIFMRCNEQYFDNSLPKPKLALHCSVTVPGKYDYTIDEYGDILRDCISISKSFDWDEEHLVDVVLHEMIHEYVYEFHHDKGDGPHGQSFQYVMNIINNKFGRHITIDHDLSNMKRVKWTYRLAWWLSNNRHYL